MSDYTRRRYSSKTRLFWMCLPSEGRKRERWVEKRRARYFVCPETTGCGRRKATWGGRRIAGGVDSWIANVTL